MNPDLKRRLKSLAKLSDREQGFLGALEDRLIAETTSRWVTIEYAPIESDDDDTAFVAYSGGAFFVTLDDRLQFGTVIDYLLHEFAHIGTWFVNEKDDHGPIFGVEWARMYRIYLQMYNKWFE